jgi:DNA-binding LacI/PurR family transcriptional regulator
MSATIYDIAKLTGYNPGTVSRALNGDPRVKPKTQEIIRKAGELLGYVPNLAAKSLITKKTGVIAVVSQTASNGPMTALMLGMNKLLFKHDYMLMSLIYNTKEQFQRCMARLKCGFCDGAILLSPPEEYVKVPEFELLLKSNYPLVVFDQWIPGLPLPQLTNDAEKSITLLTNELMKVGMDGAYLNFYFDNIVTKWRKSTTEKLLREANIPYTCDPEKIPELFKEHKIRNFGVYSDCPNTPLHDVERFLPREGDIQCYGAIFDSWHKVFPRYFSRIFLCVQDIDGESEAALNILFDMMNGKTPSHERINYPPKEILTL